MKSNNVVTYITICILSLAAFVFFFDLVGESPIKKDQNDLAQVSAKKNIPIITKKSNTPRSDDRKIDHRISKKIRLDFRKSKDKKVKIESIDQYIQMIEQADMLSYNSLSQTLIRLKQGAKKSAHQALLKAYESKKEGASFERTKLLWFAKRMNHPDLIPIWDGILKRNTTDANRFSEMSGNHEHLSVSTRGEMSEDLISLRALGALSHNHKGSMDILQEIAIGNQSYPVSKFHRKVALNHIKKANPITYVRLKRKNHDQ
ncbi:MAG: hypothetical protein CMP10_07425 [Zetaproteobacteria bacterium]|nr:hypothetical protein [Pseudobdellovibrionaceae bacterium]